MTATTALPAQASFWPLPIALQRVSEEPSSLYRFSLEQYHQMARQGILAGNNHVEFLEGILVNKMTKNRAHSLATHRLRVLLEGLAPEGYYVESQEPTTTTDSEPEPDVMVVRGKLEDYQDQQPPASQVPLIAEVADSSLQQDRNWKKRIYARAGIPVYWIVNLIDRQMEVLTQPSGEVETPDYAQCQVYGLGQELPVVLDGKDVGRIAVKDVLP
ncbi:MAG: Uma2 family endonuclease [Planctomycetales bacterium]|nr:Uma2 family endonuclease [Planctomycetales bacterium]